MNGHVWKNWESVAAIEWARFVSELSRKVETAERATFLVVEGFLLLATTESQALFDAVIHLKISKEECWRRRRDRAIGMRHLPPGLGENKNYEVLETYVTKDADVDAMRTEAAKTYSEEGELAWLRMYFEEVIWPASAEQAEKVSQLAKRGFPILEVSADDPPGRRAWKLVNFPTCLGFVRNLAP